MNSYIYKKIIIFQNYLISLDEKHTKLSTLIFFIFIIIESGLLILSFYPDFNLASAIGHDIIFHLNRFYGLSQAIENGSYPFYINSHSLNGYGYAVNLFYPDLTILPFSLIINKLGLVNAYKVMIFSYTVICALFSFFAIKKITSDKLIAYIFTLLYTFSLYRIVDIVGKGAIAEYLAFTFIPLIINGFYEVVYNNYKKWYILSIGYSLLIYTHLLSSLLILIVLIVFTIRAILHNQITFLRFKYLGLSTIVTLLLSTFLVLPMFEQLSSNSFYLQTYPLVSKTTINGSHITLLIKGLIEGINGSKFISESIGILITLFLLSRLVLKDKTSLLKLADFCTVTGIVLYLVVSEFFPWNLFPFNQLSIIQFPFRFFVIITTLLSFSAAIYARLFIKKYNCYLLMLSFLFLGTSFTIIRIGLQFKDPTKIATVCNDIEKLNTTNIIAGEYLPSRVPILGTILNPIDLYRRDFFEQRGQVITNSDTGLNIGIGLHTNQYFSFNTLEDTEQKLTLPLLYYKGYTATLNNKEIELKQSNEGLVEIDFIGKGEIKVWYAGTTIQQISFLISLIILVIYLIFRNKFNSFKN